MDWLKNVAPWIFTAATGGVPALIGMAAKELTGALGYEVEPNKESIAKAVESATHEQLLAIKQADYDFQLKMKELGYEHIENLEALAVDDRKSAREREMAVRDWIPSALAVLVTIGYFGVLAFMLSEGVPTEGGEALLVMLGALGTAWGSIIAYYYGSSAGSARKTELYQMQNK